MGETQEKEKIGFGKEDIKKIITIIFFVFLQSVNITIIYSVVSYGVVACKESSIYFSVFLNILLTGLIIPFTKKLSKANLVINVFMIFYMTLSQVKRIYTGDTIILSDIGFIEKIPQLAGLVLGNFSFASMKEPIIIFDLMTAYTILSYFFLKKRDFEIKGKKYRILIFVVCLTILLILMNPTKSLRDFVYNYAFSTKEYEDAYSHVSSGTYFLRYGVFPGLYGLHISNIFYEPDGFNEEELKSTVNQVGENKEKSFGKPNIIMYFSESFYDLEKTGEIKFNVPICENFNKLKAENKAISVITPTYGGMSENVAFEVITGGSNNYFPIGYIPIMSMYNDDSAVNMPSLAKELEKNGYDTKIIFGEDDYASESAFERMGFGEYIELREEGYSRSEMKHSLLLERIEEELENKEHPAFYVIESYEGHMPYDADKYESYDIEIESTSLKSDKDKEVVKSYSQAIYNSDKSLKELYDYLQEFDEPTIVIFVGDHLPYLYNDNVSNVMDKLSYFNTNDALQNYYRKYNTEALVFTNYEVDYSKLPNEVSTYLLLDSIVVNTDNKIDNYYYWLYETRNDLPAVNKYIYIDSSGKKDFLRNINGKAKEAYDLREKIQYLYFIKSRK